MPCYDPPRHEDCSAAEAAAQKRANLLCEACTLLEETGLLDRASKELQEWYKLHEELEADRVRLEAAEKLSERERRLLGIDLAALKLKVK